LLRAFWQGVARRPGYVLAGVLVVVYGWVAIHGPQGIQALLEKHREIRQLQEQNVGMALENQRRKDRIRRLEESRSEQEMEIRKQLKLLRPGETTFILPDSGQPDAPQPDSR
jgi:cell division protein FtsB